MDLCLALFRDLAVPAFNDCSAARSGDRHNQDEAGHGYCLRPGYRLGLCWNPEQPYFPGQSYFYRDTMYCYLIPGQRVPII